MYILYGYMVEICVALWNTNAHKERVIRTMNKNRAQGATGYKVNFRYPFYGASEEAEILRKAKKIQTVTEKEYDRDQKKS